jgi:hypothetical protein
MMDCVDAWLNSAHAIGSIVAGNVLVMTTTRSPRISASVS